MPASSHCEQRDYRAVSHTAASAEALGMEGSMNRILWGRVFAWLVLQRAIPATHSAPHRRAYRPGLALLLGTLLFACSAKERKFISASATDGGRANPDEAVNRLGVVPEGVEGDVQPDGVDQDASAMVTPGTPTSTACSDGACDAGPSDGQPLSLLGEPCAADLECESNICAPDVDDFTRCCDRTCGDRACERCSNDGTCGAAPVFAAECGEVTCPADDVCRDYQQGIAAGSCIEPARCAALSDCTFEFTSVARGGEACVCDGAGCTLATREPCTRNQDCNGAACRPTLTGASICCAQACGAGQVCRADGSGCELEPVCTNGQVRCSSSSYQQCLGGQWVTQRECGALGCDLALNGCRRSAGEICTTSTDCGEGSCRDTANGARVCCTAACDTACQRCTATGTTCQSLSDDAACGTIPCPADSTCRDYPASIASNRCSSGSCGAPAELCTFTSRNAGQSCSGASLCDNAGNCSVPKRTLGNACSTANQCASGQCVNSVCCESACNGVGQSCATGQCLCPGGLAECGNACADLDSDPNNCGSCGRGCLGGLCEAGTCTPVVLTTGQSSVGAGAVLPTGPTGITVDTTHVYWVVQTTQFGVQPSPNGAVRRTPKNATSTPPQALHSAQDEPRSVVTDGTNVFWGVGGNAASATGAVRVSLVNGGAIQTVAVASAPVNDIVLSGDFLYWVEHNLTAGQNSVVKRALKTSRGLPPTASELVASNPGGMDRFGIAGTCAYFNLNSNAGLLGRGCVNGTNDVFFTPPDQVIGESIAFEVDDSGVYLLRGGVWRLPLNGGQRIALDPQTLSGGNGLRDVVTDGTSVYYIDGQARRTATSACGIDWSIKKVAKSGGGAVILVPAPLPCPGRLAVDGVAVYWTNRDDGTVMKVAK